MKLITLLSTAALASAKLTKIQHSQNEFSKMVDKYFEEKSNGAHVNTIYSPKSLYNVLAAVYLGVEKNGKTHKELQKTFKFKDTFKTHRKYANALAYSSNAGELNSGLQTFSSYLIHNNRFKINANYAEDAGILGFEVSGKESLAGIEPELNKQISKDTNGLIKDFFAPGSFGAMTPLVLLNTILFKDSWDETRGEFKEKHTKVIKAWNIGEELHEARFMWSAKRKMRVFLKDGVQYLSLKFQEGAYFTVVMPMKYDSETLAAINFEEIDWDAMRNKRNAKSADLILPKFEIETDLDMKDFLRKNGCTRILKPEKADLTRMFTNKVNNAYVGAFDHKAVIKVHEKGAEAAAVTAVKIVLKTIEQKRRTYRVNRPFKFFIHTLHGNERNLFFQGVVKCPMNNCN